MPGRQLHLGAFMRPVGIHTAWWRFPGADTNANFSFKQLTHLIQTLERGKFDAFFMADHLALLNMPMQALKRSATVTSFDPMTLLPALAVLTERIGLIATSSTTYNEPYHVARKFASLDHISNGRAAWNVVTSGNPTEAWNFGREDHMEHDTRYRRGREFFDVVTGLWDSWADDAFVRDVDNAVFFDPEKMHVLNHKGDNFKVRGPLNIARPIQGYPVIVQAGASEAGRALAAETAEMIFANAISMAASQAFYADMKKRLAAAGRDKDSLKVFPGALFIVGETDEEAKNKRELLDSLVHIDSALPNLSMRMGVDMSKYDLDGPLPDLPEINNASHSARQAMVDQARAGNLTIRQLAQIAGRFGGFVISGSPKTIVDTMEQWLYNDACDGFNVMFSHAPGGVEDFVNMVVPELQRRNLFRKNYEGTTLRDHLGLKRPENQFFKKG